MILPGDPISFMIRNSINAEKEGAMNKEKEASYKRQILQLQLQQEQMKTELLRLELNQRLKK